MSDANTQDEAELSQEPEVFRKTTSGGITVSKCRAQYGKRKDLTAEVVRQRKSIHGGQMLCTQKGQTYVGKANKYRYENKITTAHTLSIATSNNNNNNNKDTVLAGFLLLDFGFGFPLFLVMYRLQTEKQFLEETLPNHSEMILKAPVSLESVLFGTQPIPLDGQRDFPDT